MPGYKKNGANREAKTEQNTVKPKQDKVFPNYRENDMKNKSETDFSERRLKWAEK